MTRQADFLLKAGPVEQAVEPSEEALRLRQKLTVDEPGRPATRREFAQASNQMGLILQALDEPQRAIEFHTEALHVAREAAEQAPSRFDLRFDTALLHLNLGAALVADSGQTKRARREYEESLRVARELARKDPDRAEVRAHVCNTLMRMPPVENLEKALEIAEDLSQAGRVDPASAHVIAAIREKLSEQASQPA